MGVPRRIATQSLNLDCNLSTTVGPKPCSQAERNILLWLTGVNQYLVVISFLRAIQCVFNFAVIRSTERRLRLKSGLTPRLCRPDVRRGYASPLLRVDTHGLRPSFGLARMFSRPKAEPGAQPKAYWSAYGAAEPRLTSGGIAASNHAKLTFRAKLLNGL